mgnify:CR=1 FL=1
MRNLRNAIRLRVKADFMSYCRDLAERRLEEGFSGEELMEISLLGFRSAFLPYEAKVNLLDEVEAELEQLKLG